MRDYYRQLGLPHGADLNEIRRAYRELARQCQSSRGNPDVGECLASLHHAYEMLSGQDRRRGSGAERPRWSTGREAALTGCASRSSARRPHTRCRPTCG